MSRVDIKNVGAVEEVKNIMDLPKVYGYGELEEEVATMHIRLNNSTQFKTNEESNMSNTRRVVTVQLIDDDKGLPVEYSLVYEDSDIVTQDDDETTIREVLMDGDVSSCLDIHNDRRADIIDNEILLRTGNSVKLRPVKLKDLRWVVKS